MLNIFVLLTTLLAVSPVLEAAADTQPFVTDWEFTRDDVSVDAASAVDYDATGWQDVRLPHDWAIYGPFDASMDDGSTAKLPWKGEGFYRRVFTLDETDAGKRVYFDFDGVMAFPKVYVNGELAGEWDYGYTPFRVDATEHVRWGEANTIVVHVDTEPWGSRWYPGAGIYRKVELTIDEPVEALGASLVLPDWAEEDREMIENPKVQAEFLIPGVEPEGVTVGTDVRLAGVSVGTVTGMALNPQTFRADTVLAIEPGVVLPDDTSIAVASERTPRS